MSAHAHARALLSGAAGPGVTSASALHPTSLSSRPPGVDSRTGRPPRGPGKWPGVGLALLARRVGGSGPVVGLMSLDSVAGMTDPTPNAPPKSTPEDGNMGS